MTTSASQFIDGFASFFRGARLLVGRPRLWPFALAPFLIGAILLGWGFVWAFGNLGGLVGSWIVTLGFVPVAWHGVVQGLSLLLLWPVFLVALFYGVYLLSKVIASPFYALLAERALIAVGHLEDRPFRVREWLRVSVRMFIVSLTKALVFGVVGFGLLLMSLIPVVNLVAGFGFLLIISFDSTDYSFEALQMGFRERLRYFRSHFFHFCGFAASLGLVFFIPGFNFLLFPVAVVGGSEMIRRIASLHKVESERF